jgi:ankyrin repeat protein
VVKTLLETGADVRARSVVRQRVVHTGNRFGDRGNDKGVVQMDLGAFTPLLFAAREGSLESAKLLLGAKADVNDTAANGASALVIAAHSGNGAMAAWLLENGALPNAAGAGYTALHAAVLRGDVDLVRALLKHGADPNVKIAKGTASRYYSTDYSLNETTLLGATPYWQAARYGDVEIMRVLKAGGADPKFAMPDGTTTLMAAIAANGGFASGDRRERYQGPGELALKTEGEDERITLESVRTAVEAGVGVNLTNKTGDTALHMAATRGLSAVVQFLVDNGASLDAKNTKGQTPLAAVLVPPQRIPGFSPLPDTNRQITIALLRKLGAKE